MFSWTVIATTGERFCEFAPYVASVNDAGTVAFQAAFRGGGTGVFTGSGGAVEEAARWALLAGVTSHPDLNNAGAMSFYGDLRGGEGAELEVGGHEVFFAAQGLVPGHGLAGVCGHSPHDRHARA